MNFERVKSFAWGASTFPFITPHSCETDQRVNNQPVSYFLLDHYVVHIQEDGRLYG